MKQGSPYDGPPPEDAGLFGFYLEETSQEVIILGLPWEVTTSYGRGTAAAPAAICKASHQLDLFDVVLGRSFGREVGMLPLSEPWAARNEECSALARPIIAAGGQVYGKEKEDLATINAACEQFNSEVYQTVRAQLERGRTVGMVGGCHGSPYGGVRAHWEKYPDMGILHVDAHADLRVAYEGFLYSHASIMYNLVHELPDLARLTSVGVRDFSEEEWRIAQQNPRITTFYDHLIQARLHQGASWHAQCQEIMATLPRQVYLSIDIDGLDPSCCPHTGTPVPGGLSFSQLLHLLEQIPLTGRRVVGFDLVEVAPDPHCPENEWDANVGARLLHRLCSLAWRGR